MSTATATAPGVPASRSSADEDPRRVARGEPVDTIDGAPVHRWGQAPAYLQTQTQLGESRLKLADGQQPLAYIRTRKFGDVALYDPAAAKKMRPLPSSTKKKMEARRTCPTCKEVRKYVVRGPKCNACWNEEQRAPATPQRPDLHGVRGGTRAAVPAAHGPMCALPRGAGGGEAGQCGALDGVRHHLPGAGLLGEDGQQGRGDPLEEGQPVRLLAAAVVPAMRGTGRTGTRRSCPARPRGPGG
ncbi:hypothetical protein [Streptomyces sp. TRM72054]|uniref:hypothetical protein n=1 Tax=Streptomyces sp. TRM72054 TaxID=2870562 RepID=UPI001C8B1DA2|nr:hypothetical protein [Streptomyces sp. TRM72054]